MLVSDAVTIVRRLLQDNEEEYRYKDIDILAGLNAGLEMAYRLRPDLFIGFYTGAVPRVALMTDPVPIDSFLCSALAEYGAGWCETKDDEFTTDGRAAMLRKQFLDCLAGTA